MVRILKCLLILSLLIWRNSYAWYCTYTPTDNGYLLEESLQCYDIEPLVALENHWCVVYQPSDPICNQFATCVNQTEQRSIACSEPNTVGFNNQSRYYDCNSSTWSAWDTVSNNCSPLPATCHENMEERSIACGPEYTGTYVEQRFTTCSTPYSIPDIGPWVMISNACTLKVTDPTNIESPINPTSPVNKAISIPVQPIPTEPVIATPESVQMQNPVAPMEQEVETKVETVKSKPSKEKTEEPVKTKQTKKTQEIVPGFGIVTSFKLLKQGNFFQQKGITDNVRIDQEQNYTKEQDILFDLIQSNDIGVNLYDSAGRRWRSLLHDNPLQSDAFDNQ